MPSVNATPNHQTAVLLALEQLHGVGAGMALMQAICARTANAGKRLRIQAWDRVLYEYQCVGLAPG